MTNFSDADQSGEMLQAGLCATCEYARRVISSKGSTFWQCGKADEDPAFAKYPRLPVIRCAGYAMIESSR